MSLLLLVALLFSLCVTRLVEATQPASTSPTTSTDCGPVRGFVDTDAVSGQRLIKYLGIPYAAPPVNARRWQYPVDLKTASSCWNGTLSATAFGNACVQFAPDGSGQFGDENCLFLNVYAPLRARDSTASLPVFVFIHGGGLMSGSSADPYLDPSNFVVDMNVVAVTMNYRMNAFGFLALQEFTSNSSTGASGNYGFADQIQSLKWIQKNIQAFGGDKTRVTVSGQSSGGTSLMALLVSPLARGLFQNALSMSASYVFDRTLTEASADNRIFVESSGCAAASDVYACLMALTPTQIMNSLPLIDFPSWSTPQISQFPVVNNRCGALGIIDGYVIPYEPQFAFKHGLANPVNTVWGTEAQEMSWFAAVNYPDLNVSQFIQTALIPTFTPFFPALPSLIVDEYRELLHPNDNAQFAYITMLADIGVTCGNNDLARQQAHGFSLSRSTSNLKVYRYYNTATPSSPVPVFGSPATGSFHLLDFISLFNTAGTAFGHYNDTNIDHLRTLLRGAIGELISTNEITSWEHVCSGSDLKTVVISNRGATGRINYREDKCELWWGNDFKLYGWAN